MLSHRGGSARAEIDGTVQRTLFPRPSVVYAFARLGSGGTYPGKDAVRRQATDKCDRAYQSASDARTGESVEPGNFWSTWPVEVNWDDAELRVNPGSITTITTAPTPQPAANRPSPG